MVTSLTNLSMVDNSLLDYLASLMVLVALSLWLIQASKKILRLVLQSLKVFLVDQAVQLMLTLPLNNLKKLNQLQLLNQLLLKLLLKAIQKLLLKVIQKLLQKVILKLLQNQFLLAQPHPQHYAEELLLSCSFEVFKHIQIQINNSSN